MKKKIKLPAWVGVVAAHLEDVLDKKVNGKVDKLTKIVTEHIEEDRKWKSEAQEFREKNLLPIVETKKRFVWLRDWAKSVGGGIVLISATIGAVIFIIKFLIGLGK